MTWNGTDGSASIASSILNLSFLTPQRLRPSFQSSSRRRVWISFLCVQTAPQIFLRRSRRRCPREEKSKCLRQIIKHGACVPTETEYRASGLRSRSSTGYISFRNRVSNIDICSRNHYQFHYNIACFSILDIEMFNRFSCSDSSVHVLTC